MFRVRDCRPKKLVKLLSLVEFKKQNTKVKSTFQPKILESQTLKTSAF